MSLDNSGKAMCPDTGLAVPECSCSRCLEAMLREFHHAVRDTDIRIRRLAPPGEPGAERRRAA